MDNITYTYSNAPMVRKTLIALARLADNGSGKRDTLVRFTKEVCWLRESCSRYLLFKMGSAVGRSKDFYDDEKFLSSIDQALEKAIGILRRNQKLALDSTVVVIETEIVDRSVLPDPLINFGVQVNRQTYQETPYDWVLYNAEKANAFVKAQNDGDKIAMYHAWNSMERPEQEILVCKRQVWASDMHYENVYASRDSIDTFKEVQRELLISREEQ